MELGPTITNAGELSVVELADNNRVAGVNINGDGATYGINGEVVDGGTIEDVTVQNATQDGVRLFNVFGDWNFRDNNFSGNGASGLLVDGIFNNTSTVVMQNNIANNNLVDGIAFRNFDPGTFIIDSNTTSGNARNGLFLSNFANSAGNGLNILNHLSDANDGDGILVDTGNGKLSIFNPTSTNNTKSGIKIRNWSNAPGQFTIVSGFDGTLGNLNNNGDGGANVDIVLDQPGLTQNVLVTNVVLSNAGNGVRAVAEGIDTVLNIEVRDNVTINNNSFWGIDYTSLDSAVVNANIGSATGDPLEITNNGSATGGGIKLLASGIGAQPAAEINATIQNVAILNSQSLVDATAQADPDTDTGANLIYETTGILIDSLDNAVVDVAVLDSSIGEARQQANLDVVNGIVARLGNDGNGLINEVLVDNVEIIVGENAATNPVTGFPRGTGILVQSVENTRADITVLNSQISPNGPVGTGDLDDETVFNDLTGNVGILIETLGDVDVIGGSYLAGPGPDPGGLITGTNFVSAAPQFTDADVPFGSIFPFSRQVSSDGVIDNLTRVTLIDNVVRDFGFSGVDITTAGDANMLLTMQGNTILNNGAGLNSDEDNDNVYGEDVVTFSTGTGAAQDNLLFFDGVNIDAYEDSVISARIFNNRFERNLERGLSLNTFQTATINAVMEGNAFVGNDRGEDVDNVFPPIANGQATPVLGDSGQFDFEAINNEEYYIRFHESQVLIGDNEGTPNNEGQVVDIVTGEALDPGIVGTFIPGNTGVDAFGNPTPFGVADLNLGLRGNSFQLETDLQDFAVLPGDFSLGLAGSNVGEFNFDAQFGQPFEITQRSFELVDSLVQAEELFFTDQGF